MINSKFNSTLSYYDHLHIWELWIYWNVMLFYYVAKWLLGFRKTLNYVILGFTINVKLILFSIYELILEEYYAWFYLKTLSLCLISYFIISFSFSMFLGYKILVTHWVWIQKHSPTYSIIQVFKKLK